MIWPQTRPTLHNGRISPGYAWACPVQPKPYTEVVCEIMSKTRLVLIANEAAPGAAGFGAGIGQQARR